MVFTDKNSRVRDINFRIIDFEQRDIRHNNNSKLHRTSPFFYTRTSTFHMLKSSISTHFADNFQKLKFRIDTPALSL